MQHNFQYCYNAGFDTKCQGIYSIVLQYCFCVGHVLDFNQKLLKFNMEIMF